MPLLKLQLQSAVSGGSHCAILSTL